MRFVSTNCVLFMHVIHAFLKNVKNMHNCHNLQNPMLLQEAPSLTICRNARFWGTDTKHKNAQNHSLWVYLWPATGCGLWTGHRSFSQWKLMFSQWNMIILLLKNVFQYTFFNTRYRIPDFRRGHLPGRKTRAPDCRFPSWPLAGKENARAGL